uniref:Osteoclast-stimulating factor 1 n=1 Tax=Hippocampus comes TaxID=109280 RepID=A0A3Q3D8T4_HIPCM
MSILYPLHEDELTLRKGDLIKNVCCIQEDGWMEGDLNGKRGLFPDNFVKVRAGEKTLSYFFRQCKVLFEYQPQNEDELELKVGDILEITEEVEEGWWSGVINGKSGLFPSNFVKEVDVAKEDGDSNATPKVKYLPAFCACRAFSILYFLFSISTFPTSKAKDFCRVTFALEATNEDELTLREDDIISIISKDTGEPGWWRGEVGGKEGVFPDNFVVMLSESEKEVRSHSKLVQSNLSFRPSKKWFHETRARPFDDNFQKYVCYKPIKRSMTNLFQAYLSRGSRKSSLKQDPEEVGCPPRPSPKKKRALEGMCRATLGSEEPRSSGSTLCLGRLSFSLTKITELRGELDEERQKRVALQVVSIP